MQILTPVYGTSTQLMTAAFSDIIEFLDDQIKKSEIFSIPLQNLKPDEIREFDKAKEEYSNREYDIAVSQLDR